VYASQDFNDNRLNCIGVLLSTISTLNIHRCNAGINRLWKESLNSDGHQFHQYQQKRAITYHPKQTHRTQKSTECDVGNPGPGLW